ncbi:uroporphyrinogen-III C-methyltransferase [Methanothermococcus okinawensis]|uniref:uroporphyrinogen-III C-methyltransferase n=1 Tax=Methanothermococcus okinawensis (strain DSM 14208 / JCM 11175 / IH1) TaxID=647113 RepID=F8AJQ0_METOI|nr:uroporphyrinogen-III C-methyltransferase [Methanothermococcus okinawensis]AEH07248.1 uroporphyrin-III C-methyltransferase [Methanothermococcus okinawensis IH1]
MKVILVGAGPGDEELITLKGLNAIKNADVIVYDDLIGENLLKYAKDNAELIYVGKRKGKHSHKQEEINRILVEKAKENKTVVRLKGGDSFIFGRGGEEILELKKHNIPYEVIPGITSSIAVPEVADIPLTHRKVATSFTVVTGHEAEDKDKKQVKLSELNADTIVILMGITNLKHHVAELLKNSRRNEQTPVAIITNGTKSNQKIVKGTLKNIVKKAEENDIAPPGIIVIGDVVNILE